MKKPNPYEKLLAFSKQIHILESINHLLEWDLETMMPKEGIGIRSEQSSELALLIHQKKTAKAYETALSACINLKTLRIKQKGLTPREEAGLLKMQDDFIKAKKLPSKFVKKLTRLKTESSQIWAKARAENRFKDFEPYLEEMVALMRSQAEYLGYEEHPYDALLDLYEPGMTVKHLDKLFRDLKKGLLEITQVLFKRRKAGTSILTKKVDPAAQLEFCRDILKILGLTESMARLDTSSHPFCMTISARDIRLTTKIKPNQFFDAISSTMHECGHGLYESGLPLKDFGSPLGEACSLGVHESQSRLFETFIGQGKPFLKFLKSKISSFYPIEDLDKFYEAINVVEPSLIRIASDEVTYCLHIMVRYELEKKLIEGKLSAKELPKAWKQLMKEYVGVIPENDSEGCIQDIHWSMGLFGYFPTYALGNLYAAQLFEKLHTEFPQLDSSIEKGKFEAVYEWLKTHIYAFGREKSPEALITGATGKKLSAEPYLNYLKKKYHV
jgi:carboxypeptidase Taq